MPRILSIRGRSLVPPTGNGLELPPTLKNQPLLRCGKYTFVDITNMDVVYHPEGCMRMFFRADPKPMRSPQAWAWTIRGNYDVFTMADIEEPCPLPYFEDDQWVVTQATRPLDKCRFAGCPTFGLEPGIVYLGYRYR